MMISLVGVVRMALVLLLSAAAKSAPDHRFGQADNSLVAMLPSSSCSYEVYSSRLVCICHNLDSAASLRLRVADFVTGYPPSIAEVVVQQCRGVSLYLDLSNMDASDMIFKFQSIQNLTIRDISLDHGYGGEQFLQMYFSKIHELSIVGLYVPCKVKMRAMDVKKTRILNSTFIHLPVNGLEISRADLLEIRDSIFVKVMAKSIIVEETHQVLVNFNQMAINAFEVVSARDGSSLSIFCNRLIDRPLSPECSKPTTPRTTTTTTRPTTTSTLTTTTSSLLSLFVHGKGQDAAMDHPTFKDGDQQSSGHMGEIIGGVVVAILLVVSALLLAFLFLFRRRKMSKTENNDLKAGSPQGSKPDAGEAGETLLAGGSAKVQVNGADVDNDHDHDVDQDEDDDDDEHRKKFASPIWLEEIQKNRIFNKQKSMLSEDKLKELAEGKALLPAAAAAAPDTHYRQQEEVQERQPEDAAAANHDTQSGLPEHVPDLQYSSLKDEPEEDGHNEMTISA